MLELGMLIDITHMTPPARARVYQIVEHHKKGACLLASHTGAYSINPDPYALQDWELSWMGNHGCVVGVIFHELLVVACRYEDGPQVHHADY